MKGKGKEKELRLFSEEYRIFKGIYFHHSVKVGDYLTIRNGDIVLPLAGENISTVGVVYNTRKGGNVDILVRNTRRDGNRFNRDIDLWQDTLSKVEMPPNEFFTDPVANVLYTKWYHKILNMVFKRRFVEPRTAIPIARKK